MDSADFSAKAHDGAGRGAAHHPRQQAVEVKRLAQGAT